MTWQATCTPNYAPAQQRHTTHMSPASSESRQVPVEPLWPETARPKQRPFARSYLGALHRAGLVREVGRVAVGAPGSRVIENKHSTDVKWTKRRKWIKLAGEGKCPYDGMGVGRPLQCTANQVHESV